MNNIEHLLQRTKTKEYECWIKYIQPILNKRHITVELRMNEYRILSQISKDGISRLQIKDSYLFIGKKSQIIASSTAFNDNYWNLLTPQDKDLFTIIGGLSIIALLSNSTAEELAVTLRKQYRKALTKPRFT